MKEKEQNFKEKILQQISLMESNNPQKFWEMVNELRTIKQKSTVKNIEPKAWHMWFIESNNLIKPHQIGFRQGYRTADHVFVLETILNSYFKEGKRVYACFVDFSKAYDTVWRNGLLYKLIKNGLSHKFISLIKSMYKDIKMAVKLPGGLTPFFESLQE